MPSPKPADAAIIDLQNRVADLHRHVTRLEEHQDGLSTEIREAIGHVRKAVDVVQSGILEHVTGDIRSNAARDQAIREVSVDLARLATEAGRREGKKAILISTVISALAAVIGAVAKSLWG